MLGGQGGGYLGDPGRSHRTKTCTGTRLLLGWGGSFIPTPKWFNSYWLSIISIIASYFLGTKFWYNWTWLVTRRTGWCLVWLSCVHYLYICAVLFVLCVKMMFGKIVKEEQSWGNVRWGPGQECEVSWKVKSVRLGVLGELEGEQALSVRWASMSRVSCELWKQKQTN